jgi:hypothetical protein
MSDTEPTLTAPDAAPPPESVSAEGAPEDLRPLFDAQLKMLGEMAELGLKAARAVVGQAEGQAPPPATETALAYSRVSRAVRLCILLQAKLLEERDEEQELQEMFTPRYRKKARVEKIIERVAAEQAEDEDALDAIVIEAGDRLDDEDLYGDLMERPLGEIVGRLCHDLGLEPDWSELSQELWAKREGVTSPNAPALAGGGPRAEERVVEGESQAHSPSSLALTDSS